MTLLTRVGDWFKSADPAPPLRYTSDPLAGIALRGAYDPDRVPEWFAGRTPNWTPWDDHAQLADALSKVTVVFACGTYLSDAVAESPLEVYRTIDGKKEIADDRVASTVRTLLAAPNPYMSGSEFQGLLVLVMVVCGYGVVEKVRGPLNLPVELWPLRPDWLIRRQRTSSKAQGAPRYWEYRGSHADRREIPDEDLVLVPYYPDPRMERYGISPAQIAAREIGIDSGLTDFLKVFLDAGGIPPFVLTHPDPILDDATVLAMQEKWRQKYGGSRAYGSLPILHGGYQIQEIGGSIDELAWPDLRGLTEQKIAQAFRIPLELIQGQMAMQSGGLETTRFEGAMTMLQRYAAAPLRARIDGAFTRGVLAEFTGGDPAYDLAFNTDGILTLQEDEDARHARVRADWDSGLLMLDEARKLIGEAELPSHQGQVFKVAFSTVLTPVEALIEAETDAEPVALPANARATRHYRNVPGLSPAAVEVRASALARTERDRRRLAEIGTRHLRKFWQQQGERITAALIGRSIADVETRVTEAVDWQEEERQFRQLMMRFYDANGQAAFAATSQLVGVSVDWTLANPNIARVVAGLARRIVAIAEHTRQDVAQIVTEALREGATIPELADRLNGLFTETYRGRAVTVARTESQVSYNRAAVVSFAETGEIDEVELHDNSAHTEDYGASDGLSCADRNTLIVPLTGVDRHISAEHPNGTLAISPIVREA